MLQELDRKNVIDLSQLGDTTYSIMIPDERKEEIIDWVMSFGYKFHITDYIIRCPSSDLGRIRSFDDVFPNFHGPKREFTVIWY